MFYRLDFWQLVGWRRWDMSRVWLVEYVAAMSALRDARG